MADSTIRLAFGNTIVTLAYSRPLARQSEGLLVPANVRRRYGCRPGR
ncbi:MAG: hypothetical protein R2849_11390 [Thermomicrobiales bacterium]